MIKNNIKCSAGKKVKLAEALKYSRMSPPSDADPMNVFLACGFQPLHLETLISAFLENFTRTVQ